MHDAYLKSSLCFVILDSSPQRKHCSSRDAKLRRKDVDTDQETEQCGQSYQEATIDRDCKDSRRSYQELLPMNVVLEYLLKSFQPIVEVSSEIFLLSVACIGKSILTTDNFTCKHRKDNGRYTSVKSSLCRVIGGIPDIYDGLILGFEVFGLEKG